MELKDREIGLFSRKIFTGQIFAAMEKTFDQYFDEEVAKLKKQPTDEERDALREKLQKAYAEWLEGRSHEEYVFMREPTTSEAVLLQGDEVAGEILAKLPPEQQVERAEKAVVKQRARERELMDLVANCIVGSSFTVDGKQAPVEKVRDIYMQSTTAMAYLTSEWMSNMVNFQRRSAKASKE